MYDIHIYVQSKNGEVKKLYMSTFIKASMTSTLMHSIVARCPINVFGIFIAT